jgi:hypothetical protein
MPYFSRGAGFSRRPSPLLVLVGSAGVALGLISLGLAVIDNFAPGPGTLTRQAMAQQRPPALLSQQVASAHPGR